MPFVGGDEYVGPAHKHPEGVLVLRADAIRPYNCGGRAAEGAEPRVLRANCE